MSSDTLFEMDPVCETCGGAGRVWSDALASFRACPSCARRVEGRDRPVVARATDPETSHKASAQITAREGTTAVIRDGTQKHRILQVYAQMLVPISDAEAWMTAGLPARAGAWHRCSDLLEAGYITQVDTVVDPETRKEVRRCRVTQSGLDALRRTEV